MKRSIPFYLSIVTTLSLLSGCGATQKVTVAFETTEPLRVMVVPFIQRTSSGEVATRDDGSLLVDSVPGLSEELDESPSELLRQMVQTELQSSGLDVLPPYLVNAELPHHGYGQPDGSFHVEKIHSTSAKELCQHFLDCDAVLFGEVTEWDRGYYGVQTVNSVGVHLKLISTRNEKVLFEITSSDSEGRGISGGPTGLSDLVLEPIKGLDSQNIEEVARNVAREAVAPLQVKERPAYLQTPPPSIYAVAHTPKRVSADRRLLILMFAAPGNTASFSIGSYLEDFPMVEVEPGQYVGEYYPSEGFPSAPQTVSTSLTDGTGRSTEQTSASGLLSRASSR